ncbi:zinc finger protein CONSTANS-LIKE 6 [Mercurialis annua]|uniref:zinc finger protein CONSTANS-LIKE 6 n=1 Tax=Mercurialis annua TaxID=3986 RepID=UPI0021600A9B|nr:zinc finger protein CONSTANS-LIKE 6 [Mercurialis annua]
MITDRKTANVLSGKTARACDGCSRKRARWFCAADDAFLCQSCDLSVHSANLLASRHERVRLQTASFKITGSDNEPAWHQGFTRKARTPRGNGHKSFSAHQQLMKNEEKIMNNPVLPLVPEIEEDGNNTSANDDDDDGDDDDQLLYRVPVFDPFSAELCSDDMVASGEGTGIGMGNEEENIVFDDLDNLPVFLSSDMDLADFAADVENLLGLDDEDSPDYTKDLGFLDCKEEDEADDQKFFFNDQEKVTVKIKDEQQVEAIMSTDCDHLNGAFDMERDSLDWSFDYESPVMTTTDEAEEEKRIMTVAVNSEERKEMRRSSSLLRLNYEGVIDAWASQGSPWTSGSRPQVNPDDCWPHCLGTCTKDGHHYHPNGGMGGHTGGGNNRAREERVLRYKEKRRNRLFSKKIRYEVRKLNAEKRPRMKGRFVKRTSFMANVFPYINK